MWCKQFSHSHKATHETQLAQRIRAVEKCLRDGSNCKAVGHPSSGGEGLERKAHTPNPNPCPMVYRGVSAHTPNPNPCPMVYRRVSDPRVTEFIHIPLSPISPYVLVMGRGLCSHLADVVCTGGGNRLADHLLTTDAHEGLLHIL